MTSHDGSIDLHNLTVNANSGHLVTEVSESAKVSTSAPEAGNSSGGQPEQAIIVIVVSMSVFSSIGQLSTAARARGG